MVHSTNQNQHHTGADIDPGGYSRFGDSSGEFEARRQGEFICDLSHLGFAVASGPDATDFLHGQLTNDLKNLAADESQLSGYCTNKGRLICIFRIYRDHDSVFLQGGKSVLHAALDTLRRFKLRARLELDLHDDIQSFGVFGKRCALSLERLTIALPERAAGLSATTGITILRHPAAEERYQVIGPTSALEPLWQQLSAEFPVTGSWAWAAADVAQGIPAVFEQTVGKFVPHSLNMDILHAVNFKKGCYPGQEIVARMQYRGKPKSRMIRAALESGPTPAPGDKLYVSGNEQSVGMVVDAVTSERGWDMLATVRIEYIDRGDLRLNDPSGTVLSREEMPYPLPLDPAL